MQNLNFSFIIPVYNRPKETEELLDSLTKQTLKSFEVVIVEDGSSVKSNEVVQKYSDRLQINYYFKENSGPGDSRNYGMRKAEGNYFLILDSDCILPENYLEEVQKSLSADYADCFGGVDAALDSFTPVQKAINFAMTSMLTTGGVRGASEKLGKFQPRSFNMGISKEAFLSSGGFSEIHPGEDPDLSMRLWKLGYQTRLFSSVRVYHKRRIDWSKYKTQVNKFGKVRPVLNLWHPEYNKSTFWFPSIFMMGLVFSILLLIIGVPYLLCCYVAYFVLCAAVSTVQNKSIKIGLLTIWAVLIQFYGYGTGFLYSYYRTHIKKEKPIEAFPELFFKKPQL